MTQKSSDKIASSPLSRFRAKPFLFRKDGQTRFYRNGPQDYGYLVPNSQRASELQDAIPRFELASKIFGYGISIPMVLSISAMGVRYSDRMFAALSVSIAIAVIGRMLQLEWYFGDLTAGLPRTEPLDSAERRKSYLTVLVIGVGYLSFVSWRVLRAYGVG